MTPSPRALLVIDVQDSFRNRPDWDHMHNQQITDPVGRLVDAARVSGDFVVWLLHAEPRSNTTFDPVHGHVQVMSPLKPAVDEPVLVKTSANAFTTTNLQQQLVQRGVREVVTCGIRTEQCCETTARVASDLGFGVTFITDATTTSAIDGMSAQDLIDRTERVLHAREFATIATTDEMVAILTGS